MIAFPDLLSNSFSERLVSAAASFTNPRHFLNILGIFRSDIWKLFNALVVKAP